MNKKHIIYEIDRINNTENVNKILVESAETVSVDKNIIGKVLAEDIYLKQLNKTNKWNARKDNKYDK